MLFGLIIGNPPYKNPLCTYLIGTMTHKANESVILSLATIFQKDTSDIDSTVKTHFLNCNYIRKIDAYRIFPGTDFSSDLAISHFSLNHISQNSDNLSGMSQIALDCKNVIEKYLNKRDTKTIKDVLIQNKNDNTFQVQILSQRDSGGGIGHQLSNTLFNRKEIMSIVPYTMQAVFFNGKYQGKYYYEYRNGGYHTGFKPTDSLPFAVSFGNREDYANNFVETYRKPWCLNLLYLYKRSRRFPLHKVPFLFDGKFDKSYSSDEVLIEMGFSGEALEYMKKERYDYREKDYYKYLDFSKEELENGSLCPN